MKTIATFALALGFCAGALADQPETDHARLANHAHAHGPRADSHAPLGVMGDHTHAAGEWMFSYRAMHMHMEGMRSGTQDLSRSEVLGGYMVTPTKMTMQMHMFGAMYAPTDGLTLMVMAPYHVKKMDHLRRDGLEFSTSSEGWGDVSAAGLVRLIHDGPHQLHANVGMSFPTGSIDERDDLPTGRAVLPYTMQLGSGTYDLLPGLTYQYLGEGWSAGGQVRGTVRLGRNDRDYSLGDRVELTGWAQKLWRPWISTAGGLRYHAWGNVDGRDEALNPNMVPTADPANLGGQRLDAVLGLNLYATDGPLQGHRAAVELALPIYQKLDGPQLEMDWTLTVGWQWSF